MAVFADGSVLTAMRENGGLSIDQLAEAIGCDAALVMLCEQRRGLISGPLPRKLLRYLVSLKAHERSKRVKVSGRTEYRSLPIAWEFPCGAWTRAGTPCRQKATWKSGRCKLHGGLSTGPKTEEGKERIREGQRRRREREQRKEASRLQRKS